VLPNAVDNLGHPDDAPEREIARHTLAVTLLDLVRGDVVWSLRCVNEDRTPIAGRPSAVLDVFEADDDQRSPGLSGRDNFHRLRLAADLAKPWMSRFCTEKLTPNPQ